MADRSDTREAQGVEPAWKNECLELRDRVAALEAERATLREALAEFDAAGEGTWPTFVHRVRAALVSGDSRG